MSKILRIVALASVVVFGTAGLASATPVMYFVNSDGSKYLLGETHVGSVYTFTFGASFAGVTVSNALGDYAMLISFKSQTTPTWTIGSLLQAPGTDASWQIIQDDSNSNGCKTGVDNSQWCIELKHAAANLTGPQIATGTTLVWQNTMTLTGGTLNFGVNWPFKFTTTTGAFDTDKGEWVYGGYQISEEMLPCTSNVRLCNDIDLEINPLTPTVPEPASLVLLGTGLLGAVAVARRRRKTV